MRPDDDPLAFPNPEVDSPEEAAREVLVGFGFQGDDWEECYDYLIRLGTSMTHALPEALRVDANRVHGCASLVYVHLRERPRDPGVVDFLADADSPLVKGELAILQLVYSGQRAEAILAFDAQKLFRELGFDTHLTARRRQGLAEMDLHIRRFAAKLVKLPPVEKKEEA